MQNKKPNSSNWKDKLEDETAFAAGELPDTNAAWNKLYNRLHQPRRKKAIGYWMAAASIFAVIILTMLFLQQPQQIQSNNIVKEIPEKGNRKLINELNEIEPPAIAATENKRAGIKAVVKQINKKNRGKEDTIPEQKAQQLTVNSDNKIIEEPIVLLPEGTNNIHDTSLSTQIVSMQPKAKLKVVHINELGNTNDNNYKSRQATDYSVLQFGVNNQHIYNTLPSPSGKIGLNISTSKTAPSN